MAFGEEFLRHPDLFPARPAGEAWGEEELVVDSPGGPYSFEGLSALQAERLRRRYAPRLRSVQPEGSATDVVPSRVFRLAPGDLLGRPPGPWEYAFDIDHAASAVRAAGLGFLGRVEWRPTLSGAFWTCHEGEELIGAFENFFRLVTAYALVERGGALLHSAGVVLETRGNAAGAGRAPGAKVQPAGKAKPGVVLFFGPSGAGKSTLSGLALAGHREVLSDDLNAVVRGAAGWQVEKVPFAGDLGQDARRLPPLPLRGMCRLVQGPAVAVEALSPADGVASLLAASPFVNADPWRCGALADLLEQAHAAAPVRRLCFAKDSSFEEIEGALRSQDVLAATGR